MTRSSLMKRTIAVAIVAIALVFSMMLLSACSSSDNSSDSNASSSSSTESEEEVFVSVILAPTDSKYATPENLEKAATALTARMEYSSKTMGKAEVNDDGTITLKVPKSVYSTDYINSLLSLHTVEFVDTSTIEDASVRKQLENKTQEDISVKVGDPNSSNKGYEAFLTGSDLVKSNVVVGMDTSTYVTFEIDDEAKEILHEKSVELAENNGYIAILIDGTAIYSAQVLDEINADSFSISKLKSIERAAEIADEIDGGIIPMQLEISE
ncbi:MAG: SecDF P1 head subdomain-containing protein [Coriobacteriales bacterium]|jgi:preprotein translocase subunit SecD